MRVHLLSIAWLVVGCAAGTEVRSGALLEEPAAMGSLATLEVHAAPAGEPPSDGPVPVTITLRGEGRERTLPGTWIGAVSWDGSAAVLGLDRVLHRFTLEDEAVIASDVVSVPAVSLDGAHLAYAASRDGLSGDLHVLDALGDRVVGQGLGSIGALVFSPDGARVAFVGAPRSGVAGVWIADARGRHEARCLTNCTLQPDELANAVPLPASAITFEGASLRWIDGAGERHEVTP